MLNEKILFIDTETGGLDPDTHSLLSIGFVVWHDEVIVDTKEYFINDGVLNATKEALEINGMNLNEIRNSGLQPSEAIEDIDFFLRQHFSENEKITLAGHNITFDTNFLKKFFNKYNYPYSRKFSHRTIDTASILYYLYLSGVLNSKIVSSQDAFDYFNIKIPKRHTALDDAKATAELFSNLISII